MRGVAVVVCLLTLTGCHSRAPARALAPTLAGAPRLASLPAHATLAWVRPAALLANATSEDDESATLGAVRAMRLDVETVLKGERWSVLPGDTAEYLATIAIRHRSSMQPEVRVVPGTENRPRNCDTTRSGGSCVSPPPQYQTVSVPVTSSSAVLVMMRRRDGARFEYAMGHSDAKTSGGEFTRQVITLLRAR